ncbi:MAG: methionine ABC transporter substrate-binding protein, partial [Burkholderiaceae bacterium]|nr:methionine ABC transporter substrate-binding protein [Burkholderiaceae bacterium]
RALKVLETAGLIKLDPKVGIQATPLDVLENSKQLKFYEIEAAVLPRSLDDFDLSVINSNFALGAGLNPAKDALALESKDSPYANVVAVRDVDFNRSSIKELMKELHSDKVRKFISDKYQGAVVPAF